MGSMPGGILDNLYISSIQQPYEGNILGFEIAKIFHLSPALSVTQ